MRLLPVNTHAASICLWSCQCSRFGCCDSCMGISCSSYWFLVVCNVEFICAMLIYHLYIFFGELLSFDPCYKSRCLLFFYIVLSVSLTLCGYVCTCTHVHMEERTHILCVHVETRGRCWVSLSLALHLIFWDNFCHWSWSLVIGWTGWPVGPQEVETGGGQVWTTMLSFPKWAQRLETQVLKLQAWEPFTHWAFSQGPVCLLSPYLKKIFFVYFQKFPITCLFHTVFSQSVAPLPAYYLHAVFCKDTTLKFNTLSLLFFMCYILSFKAAKTCSYFQKKIK